MNFTSRLFVGAALVGAAMFSMSGAAKADVLLSFVGTQADATTPGVTDFVYNLNLPQSSQLRTGDFVTFYDVAGLTTGFVGPNSRTTAFTVSEAMVGQTPPTQAPPDNPNALNITFTYTGAAITGPTDQAGLPLAQLFIGSTSTTPVTGANPYSAQSFNLGTTAPAYNTTFVTGPGAVALVTPEPGAVAMLIGMGVTGAGFLARRRRK